MTRTRSEAAAYSLTVLAHAIGMCMVFTRTCFGLPAIGDYDGDGDADAMDGWKAAKRKHDDRNPPRGVPVYWAGGRRGYGHIAVSLGNGLVRSTDLPTMGLVGTVRLDAPERAWGMRYLGWSEDLNGALIPLDAPPPKPKPRRPADVIAALKAARLVRDRAIREKRPSLLAKSRAAIAALRKVKPKPHRPVDVQAAIDATKQALPGAKHKPVRLARPKAALRSMRQIKRR